MSELGVDFFLGLALGLPIGIVSSLLSWALLFHRLVPKLSFSKVISKIPHHDLRKARYRILIENFGRRRVIDVESICRLQIRGFHPSTPTIWKQVNLAIAGSRIPDIRPGLSRIVRIIPEETDEFQAPPYPEHIQKMAIDGTLSLEDLFELGEEVKIVLYVFSYDEFSGTRKLFTSSEYTSKSIFSGKFKEIPSWWK